MCAFFPIAFSAFLASLSVLAISEAEAWVISSSVWFAVSDFESATILSIGFAVSG
jgi:hypothetical protein